MYSPLRGTTQEGHLLVVPGEQNTQIAT